MKIAACDFDGTLYRDGTITPEDLAAITAWRRDGHVFGIVTGRGRDTLLRDVQRFSVPYDFLICNNGAMILDDQARDVYCATLPEAIRAEIVEHPGMQACSQCAFFAGTQLFVHAGKSAYWILPEYRLPQLSPAAAMELPSLHQISLAYPTLETSFEWAEALTLSCGERAGVHCSKICIDITAPDVSKASGMEHLVRMRRWSNASEVLVIGDDRNDLPMIQHFHGFAVDNAALDVQAASADVFSSVGQMLERCQ